MPDRVRPMIAVDLPAWKVREMDLRTSGSFYPYFAETTSNFTSPVHGHPLFKRRSSELLTTSLSSSEGTLMISLTLTVETIICEEHL